MVSLQASLFHKRGRFTNMPAQITAQQEEQGRQGAQEPFTQHTWWDQGTGWKNLLNNLRLIIQPAVFSCLLSPWLEVLALPSLHQGFRSLMALMNDFQGFVPI
jgi:hypothetical protein